MSANSIAEQPPMNEQQGPFQAPTASREVVFEHSQDLAALLGQLNATMCVSTYQAGKLGLIGSQDEELTLSFHNFDRPMGVAIHPSGDRLAVAARNKVWFLRNDRGVAGQLRQEGKASCFLTSSASVTGEIQAHEMGWSGDQLWVVNTLFSCLCTLAPDYNFVPRWQPSFVSGLAPEDRCHLNGLAMLDGRPKYVTAMSQTDTKGGWRPTKGETGCLIDVETDRIVASGFAMPHSPRVHLGQIWVLDSGRGALLRIDPDNGEVSTVARFPGYTRGLALHGSLAFVGLSKIRETSTFGGVPIAEDRERLKCGVGIVNLQTGELAGQFEFTSGVDEIFDVSLIPESSQTVMRGPFAEDDGQTAIWTIPQPKRGGTEF